jgi:hypothetical protein
MQLPEPARVACAGFRDFSATQGPCFTPLEAGHYRLADAAPRDNLSPV